MTTAKARREEIYHLAVTTGLASVEELSRHFAVTASTIRRDLAQLNEQGKLARTYGGAVALGAHPEPSLRQRTGEAFEQKQAIAAWAAAEVKDGESILLDGGSTVGAMAHALRDRENLSVHHAGHQHAPGTRRLAGHPGGLPRRTTPRGQPDVRRSHRRGRPGADELRPGVPGADAVTAEDGLCEADQAQTRLKELMARRGDTVYVLADSTKLGKRPFHAWARIPAPWTLVTDSHADAFQIQLFRKAGATVQLVDVGDNGAAGPAPAKRVS